jgi:hypothetical protein
MSNMSYCRFRNTLSDLRDCVDHIDDEVETDEEEGLSQEEASAREKLIELCRWIANNN